MDILYVDLTRPRSADFKRPLALFIEDVFLFAIVTSFSLVIAEGLAKVRRATWDVAR